MEENRTYEKIRFPRIFDYAVDLSPELDVDIRETNKLKKEEMQKIIEQTILWMVKQEYYSDSSIEKFAGELKLPASLVKSAVNIVVVMLNAYYRRRMDKDILANELQNSHLSNEFIESFFEIANARSSELQAMYRRRYYYSTALDRISWRIDMRLADTKRNDAPEIRVFVDMDVFEKGKDEHYIFEMREDDIFILTKALGDIVSEIGKIKQKLK